MRPTGTGRGVRQASLWLAVVLLAGLALRVAYAIDRPERGRFWDEAYALENIQGIVIKGTLEPIRPYYPSPVFNLPPAALVAAANGLARVTGDERWRAMDETGTATATGYLICRLTQTVWGLLALWLVFRIGRRLFSERVGLIAAAILAFMPWPIHSSGSFKPDAMLMMATLLALEATLAAAAARRLVLYLAAGLAIAVAMSTKLTGGLLALPLVVASAVAWRDRKRWLLLAAAGATSLVAFVLLNPYWRTYAVTLASLRRDYQMRAEWQEMSRAEIPGRLLELLLGDYGHGLVLGLLALAGLALLAVRAARGATPGSERRDLAMLLVVPPVWVASYALQTPYFKPNNFLPLLPLTSLAAAWLLELGWRLAEARMPPGVRRLAGGAAATALGVALAHSGALYVYRNTVPTTEDAAMQLIRNRLGPKQGRSVMIESPPTPGAPWGATRTAVRGILERRVERLDALGHLALDRADAELFPEERLEGEAAAFYRRRVELRRAGQIVFFRPKLFELRGPTLVALSHRWKRVQAFAARELVLCDTAPLCVTTRLPGGRAPGEHLSIAVFLPFTLLPVEQPMPALRVAGRPVELFVTRRDRSGRFALSERFAPPEGGDGSIRLEARGEPGRPQITIYRWAAKPRVGRAGEEEPTGGGPARAAVD